MGILRRHTRNTHGTNPSWTLWKRINMSCARRTARTSRGVPVTRRVEVSTWVGHVPTQSISSLSCPIIWTPCVSPTGYPRLRGHHTHCLRLSSSGSTVCHAKRKNRVSQQGDRSGVPPQEGGHSKGPKAEARATKAEGPPPAPLDRPTTAILRNIPNAFSSSMLLDLLDTHGFRARYNYIYLPVGFLDGKNLGYSFVNFLSHEDALDFTEAFNGFSAWGTGEKSGSVSWSQVQGVQAHVERYRNSPVMHPSIPNEFKPMVFQDGQCVPFPPPTKAIKAPKVRVKVASQASISPALAA